MELRDLISLYQVARLRSLSKTAIKLGVGQPTITTHFQRLEAEIEITLFDRIRRHIRLMARPYAQFMQRLKSAEVGRSRPK